MNILKVDPFNMSNGDGVRVVLWCSGCYRKCPECFSVNTWKFDQGEKLTKEMVKNIIDQCDETHISGLTLCGGEPLAHENLEGTLDLVVEFRKRFGDKKTIWSYTGYVLEDILQDKEDMSEYGDKNVSDSLVMRREIVKNYIDVLIDGPFIREKKNLTKVWRGSSNQRVIDIKKTLNNKEITLHIE